MLLRGLAMIRGMIETESTEVEQGQKKLSLAPLHACWVCRHKQLARIHQDYIDLSDFYEQDPELGSYADCRFWLMRCHSCGFIQPEGVPTLPNFFDRIYDQQWSKDWIEREFTCGYKDFIFHKVLHDLSRRVPASKRQLLDIGAHVGRLIYLAHQAGWQAEGVELNELTSSYAALRTNLPVHRVSTQHLISERRTYDAITMIDVLEHIPDPVEMLGSVHQLLNAQGWVAVKVPCGPNQLLKEYVRSRVKKNYKFSVAANLVHINHFSPASLRKALRRAGFSNITLSIGAPELSPSDAGSSIRIAASDLLRLSFYRIGRLIPGGVHTPLALNLQAYAQKA